MSRTSSFTTVLLALALAVSCAQKETAMKAKGEIPHATFAEAKVQAASSGKPILIDFYTDW